MQDDIDSPIYQKATLYHIKSSGDKIEQYLENKSFKFIWEDPKFLESILTPQKSPGGQKSLFSVDWDWHNSVLKCFTKSVVGKCHKFIQPWCYIFPFLFHEIVVNNCEDNEFWKIAKFSSNLFEGWVSFTSNLYSHPTRQVWRS